MLTHERIEDRAHAPKTSLRGRIALLALLVTSVSALPACAFLGGAAVGAAGAGAGYEYKTKRDMDRLERAFERGEINKDEYIKRKKEIEDRSVVR
jgi:hypothetical protein